MEEKNINSIEEEMKIIKKNNRLKDIIRMLSLIIVIMIILTMGVGILVMNAVHKPIIYLYPEEEIEVIVRFVDVSKITHTYPRYPDEGWNVLAKPNGDLVDLKTGRNLYSLYWEGKDNTKLDMSKGFVIKGRDTIVFLEEKLALLGLTEREANEFIIYWLPQMENNKYNFIYFAETEEVNSYMPLEVIPKPDTTIRVLMKFKPLDKYVEVKEQEIKTPERKGFTLVEWGGKEYER